MRGLEEAVCTVMGKVLAVFLFALTERHIVSRYWCFNVVESQTYQNRRRACVSFIWHQFMGQFCLEPEDQKKMATLKKTRI